MQPIDFPLRDYAMEPRRIHWVQTYLVQPCKLKALKAHSEALAAALFLQKELISSYCDILTENRDIPLYLAFAFLADYRAEFQWHAAFCYPMGRRYDFVSFRSGWLCHGCGYQTGRVLLPDYEIDSYTRYKLPLSPLLQKVRCPQCGHFLQDYLLLLDGK